MRRYRGIIILGLAVLMAVFTSALIYNWLEQQRFSLKPPLLSTVAEVQTQGVVVAAGNLTWGTKLTADMLKLVPFPAQSVPLESFASMERVEGRVLIAHVVMNEPLIEAKLAPLDVTKGGVAAITKPAKRAMAVRVDDIVGVAGFINPGNIVDVLVTMSQSPAVTKTVLQNVLVLASGTELERRGKEDKPLPVRVITVEVTPEEGEKLALAANEGKLQLALRNPLNAEPILTRGATVSALLNSYRLPEKAEVKPEVKPQVLAPVREVPSVKVELIKGSTVSTLTFK